MGLGRWRWLLVVGLASVIWVPVLWAGEIERIQARGELVVSLNKGYPPFAMMEGERVIGLDADLARLLADYLGVDLRFIWPETYDQQIPRLLAGESDIIMAAMTRTVERGLQVSFTDPYFEVSQAALVRRERLPAGADSYFDLLDIDGLRLGVKAGTTHEEFARELFAQDAIRRYPTAEAAVEGILEGEVDAMVADSPFIRRWRNTHTRYYTQIAAMLAPVTREYYAFAIRPGDPEFLNWLNLFVDQIQADGTLDLLEYTYFEQMPHASGPAISGEKMSRARFLQNRFVANRKARIEQLRQASRSKGDNYE